MPRYPSSVPNSCCCTVTPCLSTGITPDPVITPASESFVSTLEITITDTLVGAQIYYTLDGSTPSDASTLYSAPFSITADTTVKAIAYYPSYANSNVVTESYVLVVPTVDTPVIAPASQTFTGTLSVSITDTTVGADIYYTTDGSTPTTSSTLYTVAFNISATTTVKAKAFKTGYTDSGVASKTYTLGVAAVSIYWGWSTNTTLNEAQILALSGTTTDTNPFGSRTFPAATVSDYAFFWWPDTFASLAANPAGFMLGAFGVAMAEVAEGFTTADSSGYYYLPVTVGGTVGKLYRSYFQIGGASSQIIVVA
jgi:hypothetical protein